jgi:hypothetical protein
LESGSDMMAGMIVLVKGNRYVFCLLWASRSYDDLATGRERVSGRFGVLEVARWQPMSYRLMMEAGRT